MSEGQAPLDRSMWSVTPDGPIVGAEPCQPSATQDSDPGDWGIARTGAGEQHHSALKIGKHEIPSSLFSRGRSSAILEVSQGMDTIPKGASP